MGGVRERGGRRRAFPLVAGRTGWDVGHEKSGVAWATRLAQLEQLVGDGRSYLSSVRLSSCECTALASSVRLASNVVVLSATVGRAEASAVVVVVVVGVSAPGHLSAADHLSRRMLLRTLLQPILRPSLLASRQSRMASNDSSIEVCALAAAR